MKIGVLGSGVVGQRLADGFATKGHEVKLGTGHPEKPELRELGKSSRGRLSIGSFAETGAFGEVLVLCSLGTAVDEVIGLTKEANFKGKVLIDVTNALDFSRGMPPGLFVGTTDSLGEHIQRKLPEAKVVKCFNIVGNTTMTNPRLRDGSPTMLIAGNDPAAKELVAGLVRGFGWEEPIDIGGIDGARWLEALVPLWVRLATQLKSYSVAFKVLRQ